MEFPTVINWTNLFQIQGLLGSMFHPHLIFIGIFCKQIVQIWLYTAYLCPIKGTLDFSAQKN